MDVLRVCKTRIGTIIKKVCGGRDNQVIDEIPQQHHIYDSVDSRYSTHMWKRRAKQSSLNVN